MLVLEGILIGTCCSFICFIWSLYSHMVFGAVNILIVRNWGSKKWSNLLLSSKSGISASAVRPQSGIPSLFPKSWYEFGYLWGTEALEISFLKNVWWYWGLNSVFWACQAFCCLSHALVTFEIGSQFLPGLVWTTILLISSSQVARITGLSHCARLRLALI
jgi:hypothetical protein